jgi:hypothetical protein
VSLCRACPTLLFVFGDNVLRFGKGGQAIIRSEPNAYGVPTKRKPAMSPGSFFHENSEHDLDCVLESIKGLWDHLESGGAIVVPVTQEGDVSLGRERAKLPEKAPVIYEAIVRHVTEMVNTFGSIEISDDDLLKDFSRACLNPLNQN